MSSIDARLAALTVSAPSATGAPKAIWPEVGLRVALFQLGAAMNTWTRWPTKAGNSLGANL
jgi:hypothetical protein